MLSLVSWHLRYVPLRHEDRAEGRSTEGIFESQYIEYKGEKMVTGSLTLICCDEMSTPDTEDSSDKKR